MWQTPTKEQKRKRFRHDGLTISRSSIVAKMRFHPRAPVPVASKLEPFIIARASCGSTTLRMSSWSRSAAMIFEASLDPAEGMLHREAVGGVLPDRAHIDS